MDLPKEWKSVETSIDNYDGKGLMAFVRDKCVPSAIWKQFCKEFDALGPITDPNPGHAVSKRIESIIYAAGVPYILCGAEIPKTLMPVLIRIVPSIYFFELVTGFDSTKFTEGQLRNLEEQRSCLAETPKEHLRIRPHEKAHFLAWVTDRDGLHAGAKPTWNGVLGRLSLVHLLNSELDGVLAFAYHRDELAGRTLHVPRCFDAMGLYAFEPCNDPSQGTGWAYDSVKKRKGGREAVHRAGSAVRVVHVAVGSTDELVPGAMLSRGRSGDA